MAEPVPFDHSAEQGPVMQVMTHIQNFMSACRNYTTPPPSQEVLGAFQKVQIGFEQLPSETVFKFIQNLQQQLGLEQADLFMSHKFGSDILAFYYDPNDETRKSLNENLSVLLKALQPLQI